MAHTTTVPDSTQELIDRWIAVDEAEGPLGGAYDALTSEANSYARITTRYVLTGDVELARVFADLFARVKTAIEDLLRARQERVLSHDPQVSLDLPGRDV